MISLHLAIVSENKRLGYELLVYLQNTHNKNNHKKKKKKAHARQPLYPASHHNKKSIYIPIWSYKENPRRNWEDMNPPLQD